MKAKVLLAVMAAALLLAACQSPAATDKKAEKKGSGSQDRGEKGGVWKLRSRRIERYKDKHEYYI